MTAILDLVEPQVASMPLLVLANGASISLEAIDPSSGAAVSGVIVSGIIIAADDQSGSASSNPVPGPYVYVPGDVA